MEKEFYTVEQLERLIERYKKDTVSAPYIEARIWATEQLPKFEERLRKLKESLGRQPRPFPRYLINIIIVIVYKSLAAGVRKICRRFCKRLHLIDIFCQAA